MCLKVVNINGDGNCLFRAIADQLEGNESHHQKYREMAVDHILKNEQKY
jgi:OTU domain-containing protein 3